MITKNRTLNNAFSQRQLRVGELVKQNIGELLIRNEAKIPGINSKFGFRISIWASIDLEVGSTLELTVFTSPVNILLNASDVACTFNPFFKIPT